MTLLHQQASVGGRTGWQRAAAHIGVWNIKLESNRYTPQVQQHQNEKGYVAEVHCEPEQIDELLLALRLQMQLVSKHSTRWLVYLEQIKWSVKDSL